MYKYIRITVFETKPLRFVLSVCIYIYIYILFASKITIAFLCNIQKFIFEREYFYFLISAESLYVVECYAHVEIWELCGRFGNRWRVVCRWPGRIPLVYPPSFCLRGLGGEIRQLPWQFACALVDEFLRGCDVRRTVRFGRLLSRYTRLERKYISGFQFTVIG